MFKNVENILSHRLEVEKNHITRKTCLKLDTQKWNEYFYYFVHLEGSMKHIYHIFTFFCTLPPLKKIEKNVNVLSLWRYVTPEFIYLSCCQIDST